MQITRFTDLGLRVLMYLAARPEAMATIPPRSPSSSTSRATIWSRWCIGWASCS